jgi:hypothetical protein
LEPEQSGALVCSSSARAVIDDLDDERPAVLDDVDAEVGRVGVLDRVREALR